MDAFFVVAVLLPLLIIMVFVAVLRWAFRVNLMVGYLKRIAEGIEYIIDADKKGD